VILVTLYLTAVVLEVSFSGKTDKDRQGPEKRLRFRVLPKWHMCPGLSLPRNSNRDTSCRDDKTIVGR